MAAGVFDKCYNDMPSKAYDALNNRIAEWTGHSIIDMASISQNRNFVAHPCCQKWITNHFMGNVKFRELPWGFMTFPIYIKVILCAFFVFPMYLWVRFKETSSREFIGADEYEVGDPYYIPEQKPEKESVPREDAGRAHLLKYHYPPLWQMILWMWSAPITKFWVSNIFYIIYLAIFSLAVLWPSCGSKILDSIVCGWTITIAIDSTCRLFNIKEAFPNTPLFASCLEIIYMVLFVIFHFLIRISGIGAFQHPYAGKILLCGALLWFYYRMIFIYLPISSTLGPLLYRVKRMITVDFLNFMKLVVFILIGNGIAMQAMLYPDYPLIPELIRKSFHKAFMAFFLTPVEELTNTAGNCVKWEQKPKSDTLCRVSDYLDGKCSSGIAFWPYVLVFQYILLLKLVLMTVLFALFNNTGAKIGPESNSIWKFQRYKLIVNFSNSLRLPPPLNIFSVLIMIYKAIKSCCRSCFSRAKKKKDAPAKVDENEKNIQSLFERSYWIQLANDYYLEREHEKKEDQYIKKELDLITQLSEDLNIKETMIYRAKSQITQLEANICYTHAYLEALKYRKPEEEDRKEISHHSLSRESPYPGTRIQRFPVPDKYVPWEVLWMHYEPSIYTLPKEEFSQMLLPYVDDDIISLRESDIEKSDLPVFTWNMESVDSNGVYRNRSSWMLDGKGEPLTYRLDIDNLPRNPKGRTGLRGKGSLPRWGPNHKLFVIITRWKKKEDKPDHGLIEALDDRLEYVETFLMKKKELSLPGGYSWAENKYEVVQSCFAMENGSRRWETSADMIEFFKEHAIGLPDTEPSEDDFKARHVYCGYMDDQMNTDQAWKEVELWHIHYNIWTNLYRRFKANIRWRLLSEDVFIRLPYGQTTLLQNAIRDLKANIVDD